MATALKYIPTRKTRVPFTDDVQRLTRFDALNPGDDDTPTYARSSPRTAISERSPASKKPRPSKPN